MNRSIQWLLTVLLVFVVMISTGACRENAPPPVAEAPPQTVEAPAPQAEAPSPQAEAPPPQAEASPPQADAAPQAEAPPSQTEALSPQAEAARKAVSEKFMAAAQQGGQSNQDGDKKGKKKTKSSESPPAIQKPARDYKDVPGDNRSKSPPLAKDGIHDPNSPAMQLLQNPSQSLSAIPTGKWGEVDWMQAVRQGVIKPWASMGGKGTMEILDLDIIMTNTKNMPHIRFPHESHTQWLACSNCHPGVFVQKKGANTITMNDIFRGRYCGTCHGRVAFSVYICQRCHSIPHENSPQKWW